MISWKSLRGPRSKKKHLKTFDFANLDDTDINFIKQQIHSEEYRLIYSLFSNKNQAYVNTQDSKKI